MRILNASTTPHHQILLFHDEVVLLLLLRDVEALTKPRQANQNARGILISRQIRINRILLNSLAHIALDSLHLQLDLSILLLNCQPRQLLIHYLLLHFNDSEAELD